MENKGVFEIMAHTNLNKFVVYDVEISRQVEDVPGRWDNPEGMGFGSAVVYSYEDGQYSFFLHQKGLGELVRFLTGKICVTFNGVSFDSRVIQGNDRVIVGDPLITTKSKKSGVVGIPSAWKNYDILLKYIKGRFGYNNIEEAMGRLGDRAIHDGSFSLDGIAEDTFGLHKSGTGAHAPVLYHEEKYAELLAYNLQDVWLTKKLFEFIQEYGFVVDRAGRCVRIALTAH